MNLKTNFRSPFEIANHVKTMFILTKMKSVVRLEPSSFERSLPDALKDALTEKLANKVLKDVGLVIALWDILKIGDSYLLPGDGASHTRVEFRILVFRPFMEEVLVGKVCYDCYLCLKAGFIQLNRWYLL